MKQFLDFLPLVVFFAFYKIYDIYAATAALIVATAIVLIYSWVRFRKVEKMALITFVLVVVFGGLTLFFHNVEKYEMHRLIGALLSSELKEQEKLDIIEHEYNIPISQEFREDVRIMCNLSTGIEEGATERATKKATEKTSEKFILNMYKKGYTLDQIADVAETGVDEVEAMLKKCIVLKELCV